MRPPRLSVRRMMLLIALLALGLYAWQEFQDGLPPRFVIRGIPARIHRLKPGMSWQETRDILGLETSWLKGGTDASFAFGHGLASGVNETYNVRPWRIVMEPASVGGGPVRPTGYARSMAMIHITFSRGIDSAMDWHRGKDTRLVHASFSCAGVVLAEMPHGPQPSDTPELIPPPGRAHDWLPTR